jgi:uncharacterized protein YceK
VFLTVILVIAASLFSGCMTMFSTDNGKLSYGEIRGARERRA